MNSGYLLKQIIPVEVQGEERPTSPALLRSSSSHTPYSNYTSGSLPSLYFLNFNVYPNDLRGVSGGPFIAWRSRFLGEIRAGTQVTDIIMAVATFLPRLWGPGSRPGSTDPCGRPAPRWAPSAPPSRGSLAGGSIS